MATDDDATARWGLRWTVIGIVVAILLAGAVWALDYGGQRQHDYDSARTACLDSLDAYGSGLIGFADLKQPPSGEKVGQLSGLQSGVETHCFNTGVIDAGGAYVGSWESFNHTLDAGWFSIGHADPPLSQIAQIQTAILRALAQATDNAYSTVSHSPDRSILFWQDPAPLEPRFPDLDASQSK